MSIRESSIANRPPHLPWGGRPDTPKGIRTKDLSARRYLLELTASGFATSSSPNKAIGTEQNAHSNSWLVMPADESSSQHSSLTRKAFRGILIPRYHKETIQ